MSRNAFPRLEREYNEREERLDEIRDRLKRSDAPHSPDPRQSQRAYPGIDKRAVNMRVAILEGALGDLERFASQHIKPGINGYAHLIHAQALLRSSAGVTASGDYGRTGSSQHEAHLPASLYVHRADTPPNPPTVLTTTDRRIKQTCYPGIDQRAPASATPRTDRVSEFASAESAWHDLARELERELEAKRLHLKAQGKIGEEVRRELADAKETIEACHVLIDEEDRGPSRAISTDGGATWKPHTLQYRIGILLRVNKEACDVIERAEAAEQKLACKCVCEFTGSGNQRKINKTCALHAKEKAAAVAQEREACAALHKEIQPQGYGYKGHAANAWHEALESYEAAIRARSKENPNG